eukprot:1351827-Rhodomonas_salina.1
MPVLGLIQCADEGLSPEVECFRKGGGVRVVEAGRRWVTWVSRDLVALRNRYGLPHSRPGGHVTVPRAH